MSARDPVAALFDAARPLPIRSAVRCELICYARNIESGLQNEADVLHMFDAYGKMQETWTPDERAAFALAREALGGAGVEGGAR